MTLEFVAIATLWILLIAAVLFGQYQERRTRRELDDLQERIKPALAIIRADFDRLIREQKERPEWKL
jgi:hypothetical protein